MSLPRAVQIVSTLLETEEDWPLKQEIIQAAYRDSYERELLDAVYQAYPEIQTGAGVRVLPMRTAVCLISIWSYWDATEPEREKLLRDIAQFSKEWLERMIGMTINTTIFDTQKREKTRRGYDEWQTVIIHIQNAEDAGKISMRLRALANTANTIAHPHLGETEEETFSAKQYLSSILPDLVRYPIHQKISEIPGGVRRQGEGHNDQWEFVYKDWLFVVSAYEKDGSQIWSAHYKAPAFGWSSEEERARGWAWSMGGDLIEKLPANYNPKTYFSKLKKMADANPNVWEKGWIPYMPEP